MKKAFLTFQAEFDGLLDFLSSVESEDKLLQHILTENVDEADQLVANARTIVRSSTNRKRFVHCQAIIVLYGALERFVEDAIREYVVEARKLCTAYEQLPKAIKDKHSELSIEYLSRLKDGKVSGVQEGELHSAISRLNSSIQEQPDFLLNDKAFVLRNANASLDRIRILLSNIGIPMHLPTLLGMKSYQTGYIELYGMEPEKGDDEAIKRNFSKVDTLVSMRNQIAHGVVDVDNIEDVDLLRERAMDLRNFVIAVSDLMEMYFVKYCAEDHISSALSKPLAVYDNKIVCIPFSTGEITIGDVVALQVNDNDIRFGSIQSIQVDNVDMESVTGHPGTSLGFKVGFHAIQREGYRLLPHKVSSLLRNSVFEII
jgi:hypothetical protein